MCMVPEEPPGRVGHPISWERLISEKINVVILVLVETRLFFGLKTKVCPAAFLNYIGEIN